MHALFIPISQEEPYSSMVPRNCIQRCTCESIKYVDKLTHCEEKIEVAKQTEIHNFAEVIFLFNEKKFHIILLGIINEIV